MKRRNLLICIVIIIVLLCGIMFAWYKLRSNKIEEEKPTEIKKLDTIEKYGYSLEDRDTELFKENFEALREILNKSEINFDEYAKYLSKLFIIDLYTISNKVNQYDVGGSEYVFEPKRENFELKVRDTLYKYVEDNTYGKRVQVLPEVVNIEVLESKSETIRVLDQDYEGFTLTLNWSYVKDLDYDKKCILKLIKVENKLYVVSESTSL